MEATTVPRRPRNVDVAGSHGIDADPARRPGVPMHAPPARAEGAHWEHPERQANAEEHLHRAALERPTPVVGTGVPPRGLSGALRRRAYETPEHYARHWAMLLAADRLDVVEDRLGELMAGPLESAGMHEGARRVRENPLVMAAGVVVGAWLAKKVLL